MSGLARLNALPATEAEADLLACCGSREWARRVAALRPFASEEALFDAADVVWWALDRDDWLQAFRSHPRIGEKKAEAGQTGREQGWSRGEQAGMDTAEAATRRALADGNRAYEERFGHIYLVCATGRSADELLSILTSRLDNEPEAELRVAAGEQAKITRLRLQKLLAAGN
ncbi:MAG TPA: 2-oxo-4-hydroxy-4-carboxy-5-ureidoimidazoline decarboxylase [Longimicrobium sp.]|nr:2-oxo-4-hydroxy-4-carboxy-5-ureidoimidazoline decarboxylase [Longimicrobium sp.]